MPLDRQSTPGKTGYWDSQKLTEVIKKATASPDTGVGVKMGLSVWRHVATEFGRVLCGKQGTSPIAVPPSVAEGEGAGYDDEADDEIFGPVMS